MKPLSMLAVLLALAALPAPAGAAKQAPVFPDAQDDTVPGQPCCAFVTQRPGAEVVAFYQKHLGAKPLGPDEVAARYPAHAQQMAMVKQMSGGGRKTSYFVLAEQGSGAGKSAALLTVDEMPALGTTISIPEGYVAKGPAGASAAGTPQPPSKFDAATKSFEQQAQEIERQAREGARERVKRLPLARKADYNLPVPDGARRETGMNTHHESRSCYSAILYVAEPYARVAPFYERSLRGVLPLFQRGESDLLFRERQFGLRVKSREEGGRVDAYGKRGGLNRSVLVSPMHDVMTRIELESEIADESCAISAPALTDWRPGPIPEDLR